VCQLDKFVSFRKLEFRCILIFFVLVFFFIIIILFYCDKKLEAQCLKFSFLELRMDVVV
jgi:hypothetical protein